MSQQNQGDMTIPAMPMAYFVVGQTNFAFGFLQQLLDGMVRQSNGNQFDQRGVSRGI